MLVDTPGFQDDPSLGLNTEERVLESIEAAVNKRQVDADVPNMFKN